MSVLIQKPIYPNLEASLSKNGYTYKILAEILGVSQAFITRRMKGEVDWSLKLAIKIAALLGEPVEVLFKTQRKE